MTFFMGTASFLIELKFWGLRIEGLYLYVIQDVVQVVFMICRDPIGLLVLG